jgi:hypothetical protein
MLFSLLPKIRLKPVVSTRHRHYYNRKDKDARQLTYALTPAEIALMWQTAPPRMPMPRPAA